MVLDGLDPNTEYYVNVTAVTDTFESDASNGLRVMTQPVAALAASATGVCVCVCMSERVREREREKSCIYVHSCIVYCI